jgi:hypothetical protein
MQHCESRADGCTPWRHSEVQQSRRLTWSAGLPTQVDRGSVVAVTAVARKTVKQQSGCACRALGALEPKF